MHVNFSKAVNWHITIVVMKYKQPEYCMFINMALADIQCCQPAGLCCWLCAAAK